MTHVPILGTPKIADRAAQAAFRDRTYRAYRHLRPWAKNFLEKPV